jgi:CDP-6-deoxy-D-xylo-4-hexulose-3-dehydrase
MKYPLVLSPFDKSDTNILHAAIDRGQFTMGKEVALFEKEFAAKMGVKYAVMVNSGSSANLIASFAFLYSEKYKLNPGDEVLVPAIGWSTTWAPLHQAGFNLKVVDVDPETLNVSFESYVKAVTPKTKMIATVSILGNPLEFEKLRDYCNENNLILFEDNCESIGAKCGNKFCGTFGEVGTFSFFYSHHISTMEGGMVLTNDDELYHILLSLRAHGWVRDLPEQSSLADSNEILEKNKYRFVLPGFNVRPLELSGALGRNQLVKLDGNIRQRRLNAEEFTTRLSHLNESFQFQIEKYGISSWYSFTIVLKNGNINLRNRLMDHLKKHGIESRMITGGCLTKHPMSSYFRFSKFERPTAAERIHDCGIFVANHNAPMSDMISELKIALETFRVEDDV